MRIKIRHQAVRIQPVLYDSPKVQESTPQSWKLQLSVCIEHKGGNLNGVGSGTVLVVHLKDT